MAERSRTPRPMTSLIGRKRDLAALAEAVTDPDVRLVSIVGAGGIGKTRLALEVIDLVRDDFDEEPVFIDLAPVHDAGLVPERILAALGVELPESGSLEDALVEVLDDRQLLLVLDNMEQLLDAAPLVERLLQRCPDIVIVATMRQRLRLPAERLFELAPLETPDQHGTQSIDTIAASDAVQLFIERARAVERSYELTEENAADVAAICRRLDGLPLAIELAAARINEIPPRLILRNFARILPFLERTSADPQGRHRTLRDAIEWSYLSLNDDERRLFRRLAVFQSGCSIDGAIAVGFADADTTHARIDDATTSVVKLLGSLAEKQLLTRRNWAGNTPRYGMLETVREYGRDALAREDDEAAARNRHAAYAISMAEEFRGHLRSAEPGEWLDRSEEEINEFRAALEWLLTQSEGGAAQALVLSNRLDYFWGWRGHAREGLRWISTALSQVDDRETLEGATALLNLGNLTFSDLAASSKYYEASLAILRKLDHKVGIAGLLSSLGLNAEQRGDFDQATAYLDESLKRFSEMEYDAGVALCAFHLGTLAGYRGDYQSAIERLDESRTLSDQLGDATSAHFAMIEMGRFYRLGGKYAEAVAILTWALQRLVDANIGQGIRHARNELGWTNLARASYAEALSLFHDVIRLSMSTLTYDLFLVQSLRGIATIEINRGDLANGVTLLSAAERWERSAQAHPPLGDQQLVQAELERARSRLAEDAFLNAWSDGTLVSIEDACRRALDVMLVRESAAVPADLAPSNSLPLTPQERVVLCRLAKGEKNRQIAEGLFISERTVAVHVQNILRKLDADNRTHASALAFQAGLCSGG